MKAMVINGARPVSGSYDFNVQAAVNSQGWGLINLPTSLPGSLTNLTAATNSIIVVEQNPTNALATGQSHTRSLALSPAARNQPLRITLVWTDPPGDPIASVKLVNDLDLIVTNLDTQEVFFGNDIAAGSDFNVPWDTNTIANVDTVNNVENVYLTPALTLDGRLSTNYTVTVVGHRVNVNAVTANPNNVAQDYALVISSGDGQPANKKKAYEIFDEITKKVYVMELPNKKSDDGKLLWKNEIKRLADKLSDVTGKAITLDKLKEASGVVNAKRQALKRLSDLRACDPAPISGLDALLINQISFYDDPKRFTEKVNELCDELDERTRQGKGVAPKGAPRILVSGSPMAIPNWKLHWIIESSGAVVVGEEACVGERNFRDLLENFSTVDEAIQKMADRSMGINCACFTPNDDRLTDINSMSQRLHSQGVIHYALQFCTPYLVEAFRAKNAVESAGLPFLRIETDYSLEDAGQLKTRVEAFIEIIRDGKMS